MVAVNTTGAPRVDGFSPEVVVVVVELGGRVAEFTVIVADADAVPLAQIVPIAKLQEPNAVGMPPRDAAFDVPVNLIARPGGGTPVMLKAQSMPLFTVSVCE